MSKRLLSMILALALLVGSLGGVIPVFAEETPVSETTEPGLTNLALSRNASVSVSLVPGDAHMLNDGIISSREGNDLDAGPRNRWNTYPTGGTQWAAIELTQKRDIYRVDWYALEDTAGTPAANVALEYWTGYEWLELDVEPVKSEAEGEYCDSKYSTAYLYRFELTQPLNTNKVRVRIDQITGGKYGAGGTELEVWGLETGLTNLAAVSSTTLIASHGGSSADPLSELNDGIISAREGGEKYGDPRNRWNTWPTGGQQWVGARFEWEQEVEQVLWYALEDGAGTPTVSAMTLQTWNGTEWVDTGITPTKTRWEGPYNDAADPVTCATAYVYAFDFAEPIVTSQLRLVMTQLEGKYGVGGTELEIWGQYQIQYGFDLEPGEIENDILGGTLYTNEGAEDRTLYVKLTDGKGDVVETTIAVAAGSEEQAIAIDLSALAVGTIGITASWNADYTESKTYSVTKPITDSIIQEIYDEIKTPYEYGIIVSHSGVSGDFDASLVDNPNVFAIPGDDEYIYMTYVGHDGVGYRTGLARSKDMVTWEKVGVILDNGEDGNWDSYNAAGYIVRDHVWGQIPTPHVTSDGLYAMTYLASDQPGYEAGIKRAGVAFTDTIFNEDGTPAEWNRYENPVLDAQGGEYAYEKGIIWKLQAIFNPEDGLYYGFYNAATGPEVMCGATSQDLLSWTRMETNPLLNRDTDSNGGTWGSSHNADADVFKVGDYWVMVYFTSTPGKGIIDSFAVSTDLQNWQKSYTYLTARNSTWSSTYAHKPCMVKVNGVVYHYYCAVGNQGRVIAVDTSIDLTVLKTAQAVLETQLNETQKARLTEAIGKLQYELRRDGGSLEQVEAARDALSTLLENLDSITAAVVAEGYTGDLTWALDANGKLTFEVLNEVGKMKKYVAKNEVPWVEYMDQITSVEIPEGVTRISAYTFYGATNLTSVVVPSTVKEISAYAFKNSGLTSVTLTNGLVTIGDSAFYGTGITEIVIPETVVTIGEYAFARSGLTAITFTGNAPTIGEGTFNKIIVNASYPAGNETWTEDVLQNYGGTVTWTAK